MIPTRAIVEAAPGLTAADLGGEAVLLDVNTGQYFGLNEVALRIFELVQEPRTVEEIGEALLVEYDVEPAVIMRDLDGFLHTLSQRKLITIQEGEPRSS
jgi:hypothetical protein